MTIRLEAARGWKGESPQGGGCAKVGDQRPGALGGVLTRKLVVTITQEENLILAKIAEAKKAEATAKLEQGKWFRTT